MFLMQIKCEQNHCFCRKKSLEWQHLSIAKLQCYMWPTFITKNNIIVHTHSLALSHFKLQFHEWRTLKYFQHLHYMYWNKEGNYWFRHWVSGLLCVCIFEGYGTAFYCNEKSDLDTFNVAGNNGKFPNPYFAFRIQRSILVGRKPKEKISQ